MKDGLDHVSPDGCEIFNCRTQPQDSPGMKSSASVHPKAHLSGDVLAVFTFEALYK